MELGNRIQIVYKSIDELKPYANNPRNNKKAVAAVANSIKSFGFKVPIVIDKNNEIVCGHTRLLAGKQLEIPEVPCIYADDLNEEEIRAFRLADNKTAELASWNTGMLATELNMIVNFSMSDFGFDHAKGLVSEDTFDDKVPVESISRRGDIWCLGRHRLMCGDATSVDDVHTLLGDKLADMYITDPPYNVDYTGKTKDALKIQNDTMEDEKFRAFLAAAFFAANSVMKPGATFYIWHADSEGYNFRGACHDIGWKVRQCLIWKKNVMVMGRQDYQWKHEPCLYGWKDGATHLWAADRKQTTILEFDRPSRSKEHPTMKPVRLFDYQIQNNTKEMDVVFDSFAGSGTSIIACEQNNRICYSLELDPRYVDVIVRRYRNLVGEEADITLMRDGETIKYSDLVDTASANQ